MTTELTKKQEEIAIQLDQTVFQVIGANTMLGFQKAFQVANATKLLKEILNDEYMEPIMQLQGNRLGFKTDCDTKGGYSKAIVKNCLIEAVLTGVQPSMNQFNIIAGNMYVTKEGFGYLLKKLHGLNYGIIPGIPKVDAAQATIVMKIEWKLGDQDSQTREIEFVIKVNNFMGADAIIGKATRKARAWLYGQVTGVEVPEGDSSEETVKGGVILGAAADGTMNVEAKGEKLATNTSENVQEAKDKKAKREALANTGKDKKAIRVPADVEEAQIVHEPVSDSETKDDSSSNKTYKEVILGMTSVELVAEFKDKIPFTKDVFEAKTKHKVNGKTAIALLLSHREGLLAKEMEHVYGVKLADLLPVNENTPHATAREENDMFTQLTINDEFVDGGVDAGTAAKDLGYKDGDEMLKYITLKEVADYVAKLKVQTP